MASQPQEMTLDNIIEGKEYYLELIEMLGIAKSVRRGNRIFQAYKVLEDILKLAKEGKSVESYLDESGFDSTLLFVKVEAAELTFIFKELLRSNIDNNLLIRKLMEISEGALLPHEETVKQVLARNTQFELSLYAEFKGHGFDVRLTDPNPDLQLHINKVVYNIECKRIFSKDRNKFKVNFKKAREQLRRRLEIKDTERGIVAISVDRLIHDPQMAFTHNDSMDRLSATEHMNTRVSDELEEFISDNRRIWQSDPKFQALNIPALIFQYRGLIISGGIGQSATILRKIENAKPLPDSNYNKLLKELEAKLPL